MVERRYTHYGIGGLMLAVSVGLAFAVDLSQVTDGREAVVVVGAFLVGICYLLAGFVSDETVGPSPLQPDLFAGLAMLVAGVATAAGVSLVLTTEVGFGPNGVLPLLVGVVCALPLLGGGAIALLRSARPPRPDSGDATT